MRQVTFHRLARQELREAVAFLAQQAPERGEEFLETVLATAERALELPLAGVLGEADTRRIQIAGYPYTLVYLIRRGGLRIIAVAHHRRHPSYWHERIG